MPNAGHGLFWLALKIGQCALDANSALPWAAFGADGLAVAVILHPGPGFVLQIQHMRQHIVRLQAALGGGIQQQSVIIAQTGIAVWPGGQPALGSEVG